MQSSCQILQCKILPLQWPDKSKIISSKNIIAQVERLKDMQVEALMVEHREEGVQLCPRVVESLASGRGERRTEGKCKDGQLAAIQRHAQVVVDCKLNLSS